MRARAAGARSADALARELEERGLGSARTAIVLGSGLGAFADALGDARAVAAEELEHLPGSAVPGHAGRVVEGFVQGQRVLVQQGRVHLYEGWSGDEVTRSVRAFARLGVRTVLFTNAAGGLHPEWPPGSLMRIVDHLSLQGRTALRPAEAGLGRPYDDRVGQALERAAAQAELELRRGVYAAVLGPSYETPAEIRMIRALGADAVGMSTALEASVARAEGMRVGALSCITNHAAGLAPNPLSHAEVVAIGRSVADRWVALLAAAAGELGRAAGDG